MPIGMLFWLLMVLWLVLGIWWGWRGPAETRYPVLGGNALLFLLLFILGWRVFGFVIQ